MLGPHAIFDPAMLDVPQIDEAFRAQQSDERAWQVRGQAPRRDLDRRPIRSTRSTRWAGTAISSVVRINVRDIRPVMSHRYHLPPSAHTTFVGDRFVVCTFVPRPFETDPGAIKVPFFHNNDDYDEVIFYHAGNFFSRDNIHPGMMTLHPCGFTHGPHPKALKNVLERGEAETDEVAVMIDARDALEIDAMPAGASRVVRGLRATAGSRRPNNEARDPARQAAATARWSSSTAICSARVPVAGHRAHAAGGARRLGDDRAAARATLAERARATARRRARSSSIRRRCAAPLPRAYQWADGWPTSIMSSWCARRAARRCRQSSGPTR